MGERLASVSQDTVLVQQYKRTELAQRWLKINPLTSGNFAKKCLLKRVKPFLGHGLAKKNRNCAKMCLEVEHQTIFRS